MSSGLKWYLIIGASVGHLILVGSFIAGLVQDDFPARCAATGGRTVAVNLVWKICLKSDAVIDAPHH